MNIINTYHVGYPDLDKLGAGFLAVLTQGSDGSFAVYSGIVALPETWNNPEEYNSARTLAAEQVALHGNKEQWRRAVTFFPSIPEKGYRP